MSQIFFTDEHHRARLLKALTDYDKIDRGNCDPEYGSAFYILTSHLSVWERTKEYISERGIRFEEMLEEIDFSGGTSIMVRLASNLFNGYIHVDPVEFTRLDTTNFEIAVQALKLRFYRFKFYPVLRFYMEQED